MKRQVQDQKMPIRFFVNYDKKFRFLGTFILLNALNNKNPRCFAKSKHTKISIIPWLFSGVTPNPEDCWKLNLNFSHMISYTRIFLGIIIDLLTSTLKIIYSVDQNIDKFKFWAFISLILLQIFIYQNS